MSTYFIRRGIKMQPKLSALQMNQIARMMRVNHAGEIGANSIYAAQMKVLKNSDACEQIQHMWDQEKVHLAGMDKIIVTTRTRPSALGCLWHFCGSAVGTVTALMGKEAAMACTEAVETVIAKHYNDQIRDLMLINGSEIEKLREIISTFRDEELEHKASAIESNAHEAMCYNVLNVVIQGGCYGAIAIAKRI
jgi:ubiquinone biosynthesis monooxygenase Coq7